jgi:hypothetical protein
MNHIRIQVRLGTGPLQKPGPPHTAPLTMLNDSVDVFRAKSSGGGVSGSISSSSRTTLRLRSCSGEGDGRGRIDPLRGGGDKTVICCGERSGGGGRDGL